jgi:hypothetical protein
MRAWMWIGKGLHHDGGGYGLWFIKSAVLVVPLSVQRSFMRLFVRDRILRCDFRGIPDPHRPVFAGRSDAIAIRTKGQFGNHFGGSRQPEDLLP